MFTLQNISINAPLLFALKEFYIKSSSIILWNNKHPRLSLLFALFFWILILSQGSDKCKCMAAQYSKYMKAQLQSIICAPLLGQSDIHLVQQHRKNIQRRQEYRGHRIQGLFTYSTLCTEDLLAHHASIIPAPLTISKMRVSTWVVRTAQCINFSVT